MFLNCNWFFECSNPFVKAFIFLQPIIYALYQNKKEFLSQSILYVITLFLLSDLVNKVIPTTLVCDIPNLFKEHLELNIMSRLSRKKLEKGL